ncbi:MAG: hypothetical protein WD512_08965, partial [Candidatus Paceibacterota bacterium]
MFRLLVLGMVLMCSCREKIIHDLTELDANKLLSKFHQAEIESQKEKQADGFWSIAVSERQVIPAIQLIEDYRFFKKPQPEYLKSKLLSSEQELKLLYERSLAQELEATLQSLAGVLEAHVHLNINHDRGLWSNLKIANSNSSASILLIVSGQFSLMEQEVSHIISGAAGIKNEQINTVINFPPIIQQGGSLKNQPPVDLISSKNTFEEQVKNYFKDLPR